jgi:hypothetical protein
MRAPLGTCRDGTNLTQGDTLIVNGLRVPKGGQAAGLRQGGKGEFAREAETAGRPISVVASRPSEPLEMRRRRGPKL